MSRRSPVNRMPVVVLDARGRPWIALFGAGALATVDERGDVALHRLGSLRPQQVAADPAEGVWFASRPFTLGRLDPETGAIERWRAPGEISGNGLSVDRSGRVWIGVEDETAGAPALRGFDPASGRFLSPVTIGSGSGVVRSFTYDPSREFLWFGTDGNTLGKVTLPGGALPPPYPGG